MTTVSPMSNATSNPSASSSSSTASGTLTSNQFLSVLTTQLQNQDPLDPTDPNQFTQELVSYGSLSQQIDMNSSLNTISNNLSSLLTQVSVLAGAATSA